MLIHTESRVRVFCNNIYTASRRPYVPLYKGFRINSRYSGYRTVTSFAPRGPSGDGNRMRPPKAANTCQRYHEPVAPFPETVQLPTYMMKDSANRIATNLYRPRGV